MTRLEILKSDLKDCTDPRVLAKYPHLNNPELIQQIKDKIEEIEFGKRQLELPLP